MTKAQEEKAHMKKQSSWSWVFYFYEIAKSAKLLMVKSKY